MAAGGGRSRAGRAGGGQKAGGLFDGKMLRHFFTLKLYKGSRLREQALVCAACLNRVLCFPVLPGGGAAPQSWVRADG